MKKKVYTLRLYSHNPNEPKGRIISFSEIGKIKEKIDNVLVIETEVDAVAFLHYCEDGKIHCFFLDGGRKVSGWLCRQIEGIKLKDDFAANHFKFFEPNN